MGRATILENKGKGYYKIRVLFDNAAIDVKKAYLTEQVGQYTTEIAAQELFVLEWRDYLKEWMDYLDAYIVGHTEQQILANPKEIYTIQTKVYFHRIQYDFEKKKLATLKMKKLKAEKELLYITKYCPDYIDSYAWCVAYNENLTGTVATIEIDYNVRRDNNTNQIIDRRVAGSGNAEPAMSKTGFWLFDGAGTIDSKLQHPLASSPHALWFNICMLPAMQKWKGRYRVAIIEVIDYETNTCDIGIYGGYAVDKFQQNLLDYEPIIPHFDLNNTQQNKYKDVKANYMGTGMESFQVDDLVILDLHNGVGDPTIIGYYDNPRETTLFKIWADDDFPVYDPSFPGWHDRYRFHFTLSPNHNIMVHPEEYKIYVNGVLGPHRRLINNNGWIFDSDYVNPALSFTLFLYDESLQGTGTGRNDCYLSIYAFINDFEIQIFHNDVLKYHANINVPGVGGNSGDFTAPVFTRFTKIVGNMFGLDQTCPRPEMIEMLP